MHILRRAALSAGAISILAGAALGQAKASAKAPAFEAVSIKPSNHGIGGFGTNASGYYANGLPLYVTMMLAYFPAQSLSGFPTILGWPPSMNKDSYDIEAKFDAATAEAWKHMTTKQQGQMIRPMLQAMLAERCKMTAHMTMAVEPVYELAVTRHGPKLKQTASGEAPPEHAMPIAGDDAMVADYLYNADLKIPAWAATSPYKDHFVFFRTSMSAFAAWLSHTDSDKQVVDRTGLTGEYDFMLPEQVRQMPEPQAAGEASDPAAGRRWAFDLSGIGLELRPGKAPVPMLQVDHIEKPTEN